VLSIALASDGQHQDTAQDGARGRRNDEQHYFQKASHRRRRRLIAGSSKSRTPEELQEQHRMRRVADQLDSPDGTYPAITVRGPAIPSSIEASVSQVSAEQIFLLQQRRADRSAGNEPERERIRQRSRPAIPMEYSVD